MDGEWLDNGWQRLEEECEILAPLLIGAPVVAMAAAAAAIGSRRGGGGGGGGGGSSSCSGLPVTVFTPTDLALAVANGNVRHHCQEREQKIQVRFICHQLFSGFPPN